MNSQPVRVTMVQSEGCHFCDDARGVLAELAGRGEIQLHLLDARSTEGLKIVARHRPPMFPLVLIDDQTFSSGRLPRRKLARLLATRPHTAAVG